MTGREPSAATQRRADLLVKIKDHAECSRLNPLPRSPSGDVLLGMIRAPKFDFS